MDLEEYSMWFTIFKSNLKVILELEVDHEVGITKFTDQTPEEYSSRLGYWPHTNIVTESSLHHQDSFTPINWKEQGRVTPVKDEGYCNSSWAFAAVAALESSYAIKADLKDDKLLEFS